MLLLLEEGGGGGGGGDGVVVPAGEGLAEGLDFVVAVLPLLRVGDGDGGACFGE